LGVYGRYRDKKVVGGVFVRFFRAPLLHRIEHAKPFNKKILQQVFSKAHDSKGSKHEIALKVILVCRKNTETQVGILVQDVHSNFYCA
jgi:hypothetical protein